MDVSGSENLANSDVRLRTSAFLFTDIEGSTKLWDLYPELMRAVLARHDAILRLAIADARGEVFKLSGDGVCAVFISPNDAIAASLKIRSELHRDGFSEVGGLRVRMAIDVGVAEARDGDYFGPPLNRISRMLDIAAGDQILLTGLATDLVRNWLPATVLLENHGRRALKGIVEPVPVFQLGWAGQSRARFRSGSYRIFMASALVVLVAFVGVGWWRRPLALGQQQAALAQAVGGLPCGLLSIKGNGVTGLVGAGVPDQSFENAMKTLGPGVRPDLHVTLTSGYYCQILNILQPYHPVVSDPATEADLTLAGGNRPLHNAEAIRPLFMMPPFAGYVQADYFSDGDVYHFRQTASLHPAGKPVDFGLGIGAVSPPFDTDLFVVIVTPSPLFAAPRPQLESEAAYLADLSDALQNQGAYGNKISISVLSVVTEP